SSQATGSKPAAPRFRLILARMPALTGSEGAASGFGKTSTTGEERSGSRTFKVREPCSRGSTLPDRGSAQLITRIAPASPAVHGRAVPAAKPRGRASFMGSDTNRGPRRGSSHRHAGIAEEGSDGGNPFRDLRLAGRHCRRVYVLQRPQGHRGGGADP